MQHAADKRQVFINLRLYLMNSIAQTSGLYSEYASEIKVLMHLGRLRIKKTYDMAVS